MARQVFFSFHYERDVWRAWVIRNSWVTQLDREAAGFWDAGLWEEAKKKGRDAISRMIDRGLENTSVTAVLVGAETADREWVKYEIKESRQRGNGILGVYLHSIRDQNGYSDRQGQNPFDLLYIPQSDGRRIYLSQLYRTYDWIADDGYKNFAWWVEVAAHAAGR